MSVCNFDFEVNGCIYKVRLSNHQWYIIWCEGEILERGDLPFELVDDVESNDYLRGYAACLLDLYFFNFDGKFPIYKRGVTNANTAETSATNQPIPDA